ncbi:hypothetical protein KNE206_52780 [Kitasatospora sp. NE20-6]|uniref:ATP-binding protein n=1 Tax=Kitasatospora sp. NE20-6 TaxID=2859066 RepID=UPI0034DC90D9
MNQWHQVFGADPQSVPMARRQLREVLATWGWSDTDRLVDLLVICSELVANAVEHASEACDEVQVHLREVDGDCLIEVVDRRPDLLPPQESCPRGERGRGLLIVRDLAEDVNVVTMKESKKVCARVLLRALPEAAA